MEFVVTEILSLALELLGDTDLVSRRYRNDSVRKTLNLPAAEKLEQARALLAQGHPLPVVSAQTGVLSDTLRKTISAGRLLAKKKRGRSR